MRKLIFALLILPVLSFAQGTTTQIRHGGTLPAACSPTSGDVFFKTGASPGLYDCPTTNTWRLIATASSGSPGGSNTHVQINDSGSFYGDSCFTYDKSTHVVSLGACGSSRGLVTLKGAAGAASAPGASSSCEMYYDTTSGTSGWINTASGGCGPSEAQIIFTDITTNNASTSAHGYLKKLDNNAAHYMDGTGAWSTPAGGGGGAPTSSLYITGGYDATLSAEHSRTDLYNSADVNPSSANAMDDEFDTTFNSGGPTWVWVNQGGATATDTNGVLALSGPNSTGDSLRMICQSTPATPYTFVAKLLAISGAALQYNSAGIIIRDSGASKLMLMGKGFTNAGSVPANSPSLQIEKWTNSTTFSSQPYVKTFTGPPVWLKVQNNGTNLIWSVSNDGGNYTQIFSEGKNVYLTTPDQVCIYVNAQVADIMGSFEYFRRTQ
jgi:hypothetical protein